MYQFARWPAAAAIAISLSACGHDVITDVAVSSQPASAQSAGVMSVVASGSVVTVSLQETVQIRPSDRVSRYRATRWTTSNASVASVSNTGLATALKAGETVITATGGTTSERTTIRVVQVSSLIVTASKLTLSPGERLPLSVQATTNDGSNLATPRVTWSVASGAAVTISDAGMVTAVAAGTATVRATVAGGVSGTLALVVGGGPADPVPAVALTFRLNPKPASVQVGASLQFSTAVTWSDGAAHNYSTAYSATGGSIDVNGLYRAAMASGTFAVIASCSCGRADTSVVTVLPSNAQATLVSLKLSPSTTSLLTNGSQQFAVQATWSDGLARAVSVNYTATGGSITAGGMYTAPAATGTYRVVATQVAGTIADTATVTVVANSGGSGPSFVQPAAPITYNPSYPTLTGVSRRVNAGANLQAVLDAAQPGDEIVLASGAVFTDNYVLPAKSGNGWIVIRAENVPTSAGVRVSPTSNASSATIVSPNSAPAIKAAVGSKRWRLVGFNITQAAGLSINYGLVVLGENETVRADQPSNIVLDRMYVHGTTNDNLKRCLQFNGDSLAVIDSWLGDCHGKGFDSQGVAGWNGAGPFLIENNRIEGAGQAIMFGGSDPSIPNLSPSNIVIRRNYLYKPMSWGNGKWTVKATFELKHAKKVLFEGNVLENHWADAQVGYAILLQTVSDENRAWDWTQVADVRIENNIIKNSTSGVNVLARMNYGGGTIPTNPTSRILIANNFFTDVGRDPVSGADGKLLQFLGDNQDVTVISNTFIYGGAAYTAVSLDGNPATRFTLANNVFPTSVYGIIGSDVGVGIPAISRYTPNALVEENVFPAQPGNLYPSPNRFPATGPGVTFNNPGIGDYSLAIGSPHYSGKWGQIGINYTTLSARTFGVIQ